MKNVLLENEMRTVVKSELQTKPDERSRQRQ